MKGDRIDTRTPPCQMLAGGKLCGRTDERPTVLDVLLGPICLEHRPEFAPKPKAKEVTV